MGRADDLQAEAERKWQAAIEIAVMAGVLNRCELCGELTENQSEEKMKGAYIALQHARVKLFFPSPARRINSLRSQKLNANRTNT